MALPWKQLTAHCLCLCVLGCTLQASESTVRNLAALTKDLNERGVSNCLVIVGNAVPYGRAVLYAKAGELPCEQLWQHLLNLGL